MSTKEDYDKYREYRFALADHDWTYNYSDDDKVRRKGEAAHEALREAAKADIHQRMMLAVASMDQFNPGSGHGWGKARLECLIKTAQALLDTEIENEKKYGLNR